jgi:hypothetical protein
LDALQAKPDPGKAYSEESDRLDPPAIPLMSLLWELHLFARQGALAKRFKLRNR